MMTTAFVGDLPPGFANYIGSVTETKIDAGGEVRLARGDLWAFWFPTLPEVTAPVEARFAVASRLGDVRISPDIATFTAPDGTLVARVRAMRSARRVDALSGRPLRPNAPENASCTTGGEPDCLTAEDEPAANRRLFDVLCAMSRGSGGLLLPPLDQECFLELLNSPVVVQAPAVTVPAALGAALAGSALGKFVLIEVVSNTPPDPSPEDVAFLGSNIHELNKNEGDGPFAPYDNGLLFPGNALTHYLTQEQEALLGCGPFYGTSCDIQGIDLFSTEASVLLQAFPQFEPGGPVATRFFNGQAVTLPGARTIYDPAWNPSVDGCPAPNASINAARAARGLGSIGPEACATATKNLLQYGFANELQALSSNFLTLIAAFGTKTDPGCNITNPITCVLVGETYYHAVRRLAGDPGGLSSLRWLWENGAEYAIESATGKFSPYRGGTLFDYGLFDPSSFPSAVALTGFTAAVAATPDTDGDGIANAADLCPATADPLQTDSDGDGDGIGDACDDCIAVSNADQRDTNADGYGNACDADLNYDGIVNFADLAKLKAVFFKSDADADLDGNGVVNFADLARMKQHFFQAPGPSALAP
jgi:hypothetical protein